MQIFKGYNLFHRTVAIGLICLCFLAVLRGVLMISGGGFQVEEKRVLSLNPVDIWPYVVTPDLRDNWVVELVDHSRLSGQPDQKGSTRLLFWKQGFKRFSGAETTADVVKERLYKSYIESNDFIANWTVALTPVAPCKTEVTYHIAQRQTGFTDRYFGFFRASEERAKMQRSLDVLEEWASKKSSCTAAQDK